MMTLIQSYIFLSFVISTFLLPWMIMSRPIPRETLSFGVNDRMIINIDLEVFPPSTFALVSIGDPPVKERLHIDTGSDLTWVLHDPRSGYDPARSSSFNYRSCDGLTENVTPSEISGQCNYSQNLVDNTLYKGILGKETFTFETGDGGIGMLKNVLFGFGKTIGGPQVGTGTLGLMLGEMSILESFGRRFSICIGNFNDIRGKHFLALGDDAVFAGMKVPLDTREMTYKISLTSVTVAGEILGIQKVFFEYKTILDTGTSTISLVPQIYNAVIEKILKKLSDAGYEDIYEKNHMLCHDGKIPKHLKIGVGLEFGRVTLNISVTKLFIQVKDYYFCISVDMSPINQNLIGIPAFQGYNIGFDIPNNKLYIKYEDCHRLYDSYKDELYYPSP